MSHEELERKIEFIVDTLAQLAVNDQKHDLRLSRLERIAKLMVRAGRRERRLRREQNARWEAQFAKVNERWEAQFAKVNERWEAQFAKVNDALSALAEAQKRTDIKLDALVDIVRQQRNGGA